MVCTTFIHKTKRVEFLISTFNFVNPRYAYIVMIKHNFDHNFVYIINSSKMASRSSVISSKDLPIHAFRSQLISSINDYSTTIVVGETGSGKSTQLPQFIIDSGRYKSVVCTQPRRVAAVTVAKRVAQERGCNIGDEVGYSIRFENCTSNKTRLSFVTDGVLLREFMSDRELNKYSVVILDEVLCA